MVDSPDENLAHLGRAALARLSVMFFMKTPPLEFPFFSLQCVGDFTGWFDGEQPCIASAVSVLDHNLGEWGQVVQWADTKSWTRGLGVRGGRWWPSSGSCRSVGRAGPLLGA
jgi:hypothetical protein